MASSCSRVQMYALYSAGFASAQVAYARWLDKKKAFAELVKKTEVRQREPAVCGTYVCSSQWLLCMVVLY